MVQIHLLLLSEKTGAEEANCSWSVNFSCCHLLMVSTNSTDESQRDNEILHQKYLECITTQDVKVTFEYDSVFL
jgi:hypothetical protein